MAFKNLDELSRAIAESGQNWSDADRALAAKDMDYGNSIFTLKKNWQDAWNKGDKTAAQDIHDRTDDFRRQYGGYTGGADGSGFIKDSTYFNYDDPYKGTLDDLAAQLTGYGKFKNPYRDKAEDAAQRLEDFDPFRNPYQDKTDKVLEEYLGRGPFEYDLDSDPIWGQYQKTYLREGQRAREDTLAGYAAATGGQSSTAAVNAASQAQDYYNAQMADKVPELYKLAYDMWLNEGNQYAAQLDTLRGLGADALNEWGANRSLIGDQLAAWRNLGADALTEWDANRSLLNDQLSGIKNLSDTAYDRAYNKWQSDYGVKRDSISDTRYEDETAYNREQDSLNRQDAQKKQALAQALEWMQLGLAPDSAVTSAAGLSPEDVQSYIDAVQAQMLAKGGSGGGGRSGGSGRGSGSGSASGSGQDYDGLYAAAKQAGSNAKSFIANNYKRFGFTSSSGLYEGFQQWNNVGDAVNIASGVGSVANRLTGGKSGGGSGTGANLSDIVQKARDRIDASEYSPQATVAWLRTQGYDDNTIQRILDAL